MNMRMIVKRFLLKRAVFILLLCGVYSSNAQDLFTVSGRIVDEGNAAFEFATVSLKIQDSLTSASVITDSDGCFQLKNINRGKYKLSVSFFLQELYSQDVEVDNNINLNTIVVSAGITLNETVVTAKPTIKKEAGKYILDNISYSKFAKNRSTLEFMSTVPMLETSQEANTLKIRNKGDATILIDGKKVGGNDIAMSMLQSIPAEEIKKIEIIKSPDSKYSASDRNGIVNVILKRKENEGVKGAVSLDYRQSFYGSQNANIFLSYSKGRWIVTSGLRADNVKFRFESENKYNDHVNGQSTYLSTETVNTGRNYVPYVNANYKINDRQSVGVQLNSRFTESDNTTKTESEYRTLQMAGIDSTNMSHIREKCPNNIALFSNANYSLITDGNGSRLNIDINYYHSKNDKKTYNSFLYYNNASTKFLLNPNIKTNVFDVKLDYAKKFDNESVLRIGASFANSKIKNDYYSGTLNGKENIPIPGQKDRFKYSDYSLSGYVSYEKEINDKLEGKIGLRFEQFESKGERNTDEDADRLSSINLFPALSILYTPNDNHQFSLDVGSSITRPYYDIITPFASYTSPNTIRLSNPNLRPTYSIEVCFNYTFFENFSFDFEYTHDKNLFNGFDIIGQNGVIQNITDNYGKNDSYCFILMYYGSLVNERWNISASAEYGYSKERGSYNNINLGFNNSNYRFGVKNNIILNKKQDLILSVNYSYSGNGRSVLGKMGNHHSLTASLSKSYKNWNIAVGAYDLARSNVTLKENRAEYSFHKYSRYFKTYYVNVRYSFGKQKVKQIYDKQSDIDKRL